MEQLQYETTNIRSVVFRELLMARQSIRMYMCYFNDMALLKLMAIKAYAGIEIQLILDENSINMKNHKLFQDAAALGCEVYWRKGRGLMHNKLTIIDDSIVLTGSYNLTYGAMRNDENIVVIRNAEKSIKRMLRKLSSVLTRATLTVAGPITGDNKLLTSLIRSLELEKPEKSIIISADSKSEAMILDFPWNPFRYMELTKPELVKNENNRLSLPLFSRFPELTYYLSAIPYAIRFKCEDCGQNLITSWFQVRSLSCNCQSH